MGRSDRLLVPALSDLEVTREAPTLCWSPIAVSCRVGSITRSTHPSRTSIKGPTRRQAARIRVDARCSYPSDGGVNPLKPLKKSNNVLVASPELWGRANLGSVLIQTGR